VDNADLPSDIIIGWLGTPARHPPLFIPGWDQVAEFLSGSENFRPMIQSPLSAPRFDFYLIKSTSQPNE
jgi:hypothetical protein